MLTITPAATAKLKDAHAQYLAKFGTAAAVMGILWIDRRHNRFLDKSSVSIGFYDSDAGFSNSDQIVSHEGLRLFWSVPAEVLATSDNQVLDVLDGEFVLVTQN